MDLCEKKTNLYNEFVDLKGDKELFISYDISCDDIIIYDLLNKKNNGIYIDIGAHDPFKLSFTKSLYDKGWRGINIEPNPELCNRLKIYRTEDINLEVGVGKDTGVFNYYIHKNRPDLNTFVEDIAITWDKKDLIIKEIPVHTLTNICDKYIKSEIDVCKIDVEGLELDVLRGFDLTKYRPHLFIVEVSNPTQFTEYLEKNDYIFLKDTRCNKIYVDKQYVNNINNVDIISLLDRYYIINVQNVNLKPEILIPFHPSFKHIFEILKSGPKYIHAALAKR